MEYCNINGDIPSGFGIYLAHDMDAMNYFTNIPVSEQHEIINGRNPLNSRENIKNFIKGNEF